MPHPDIDLVEQLRDQIYALQQLVLAQCVALAQIDRSAAEAALTIAGGQAEALSNQGRIIAAQRLAMLIEEVTQCLD